MNELKPCPWCGKDMVGPPIVVEGSTFRWRQVSGCCTDGPEVRHDTLANDQAAAEIESTSKAIAAWNDRPATSVEFEAWMDRDWPLWRNDESSPAVQRLRRLHAAMSPAERSRG